MNTTSYQVLKQQESSLNILWNKIELTTLAYPEVLSIQICKEYCTTIYEDGWPEQDTTNTPYRDDDFLEIENILDDLQKKQISSTVEKSIDFLFDVIHKRLIDGQINFCNKFLARVDPYLFDLDLSVTILMMTYPWKKDLFYRKFLLDRFSEFVRLKYSKEADQILVDLG